MSKSQYIPMGWVASFFPQAAHRLGQPGLLGRRQRALAEEIEQTGTSLAMLADLRVSSSAARRPSSPRDADAIRKQEAVSRKQAGPLANSIIACSLSAYCLSGKSRRPSSSSPDIR